MIVTQAETIPWDGWGQEPDAFYTRYRWFCVDCGTKSFFSFCSQEAAADGGIGHKCSAWSC